MLTIAEEQKAGIYNHLFLGDMTTLLIELGSLRNNKSNNIDHSVRRKMSGSIIKNVDTIVSEGFGGGFLGGPLENNINKRHLLVTAADVFG